MTDLVDQRNHKDNAAGDERNRQRDVAIRGAHVGMDSMHRGQDDRAEDREEQGD